MWVRVCYEVRVFRSVREWVSEKERESLLFSIRKRDSSATYRRCNIHSGNRVLWSHMDNFQILTSNLSNMNLTAMMLSFLSWAPDSFAKCTIYLYWYWLKLKEMYIIQWSSHTRTHTCTHWHTHTHTHTHTHSRTQTLHPSLTVTEGHYRIGCAL